MSLTRMTSLLEGGRGGEGHSLCFCFFVFCLFVFVFFVFFFVFFFLNNIIFCRILLKLYFNQFNTTFLICSIKIWSCFVQVNLRLVSQIDIGFFCETTKLVPHDSLGKSADDN